MEWLLPDWHAWFRALDAIPPRGFMPTWPYWFRQLDWHLERDFCNPGRGW